MKRLTLKDVINVNKGLNILANQGVGFKDVELSFSLSLFKTDSAKLIDAFNLTLAEMEGTEEEKSKEVQVLLDKEYDLDLPDIKLGMLQESEIEIPLLAFDFLNQFIVK